MSVAVAPNAKIFMFGGVQDVKDEDEDLEGTFFNELYTLHVENERATWNLGKPESNPTDPITIFEPQNQEIGLILRSLGVSSYGFYSSNIVKLSVGKQICEKADVEAEMNDRTSFNLDLPYCPVNHVLALALSLNFALNAYKK